MPLINQEIFVKECLARKGALREVAGYCGPAIYEKYGGYVPPPVDRESALEVFAALRESLVGRGQQLGKNLRPWDFSKDCLAHLNRAEPWWGWEFETGWKDKAARQKALEFTWDNFDGVMYDSEGEGAVQVEITFIPAERSKYLDGSADACKFMDWIDANQNLVVNTGNVKVGTHLNMSDPRTKNAAQQHTLSKFMNRTLMWTQAVNGQRLEMFGRESIYAGFFTQVAGGNVWMECKGFRTTYSREQFQKYVLVADALQKCVDKFYNSTADEQKFLAVCNLYDVAFNGAEPQLKPLKELVKPVGAAALSTRFGGDIQSFGDL